MTIPTITPLPTAPALGQTADIFNTNTDAWVGSLANFTTQLNATADAIENFTSSVANGGTGVATLTANYLPKGNGTSAVSNSLIYDDGTNIGVGLTTLASGYTPGDRSINLQNAASVLWQNAAGSWNTTTTGGSITYFTDNHLYIDAKDASSSIIFRNNGIQERMRINSAGNVLVNEAAPSEVSLVHNFEVNGDIMSTGAYSGLFWANRSTTPTSDANWYGWYATSGTIYLYNPASSNIASINTSSGAYTALSDRDKKKDFEPSSIGLDAVLGLKPTLFRMKTDTEGSPKLLGFIAQEVKDHIPQAYVEESNTDASGKEGVYIGLNDRPIVAALVKAVQELASRVAELEIIKHD